MWLKLLFPMLALIAGMAVAVQGQINGGLGKKIGVIEVGTEKVQYLN